MDNDKIENIKKLTEKIDSITAEIHTLAHPDRQEDKTNIDGGLFQLVNARTVHIKDDTEKIREILDKKEKNW